MSWKNNTFFIIFAVIILTTAPAASAHSLAVISAHNTSQTASNERLTSDVSTSFASPCQEISGWKFCVNDVWAVSDEVSPGDTVTIKAEISNEGSKLGSISTYLGVRPPGEQKSYPDGQKVYDISVGEETTVEYQYEIPEDAPIGDHEVTVDVWTVNDGEMFHTSGWRQVFQTVDTKADITRTVAEGGTYNPGDDVPITFTVENTGGTTHDFYVDASVQRPNGNWEPGESTTEYLSPGETTTVTLDAEIPNNAQAGTWSAGSGVFHSSDKDEQYAYGQDLNSFEVEEENESPDADRESPNGDQSITVGESVTFEVEADDTNDNLYGVEWYVNGQHADTTRSIGGGSDTARWSYEFESAGTHTVEAVVFDEENAYSDSVGWDINADQPDETNARIVDVEYPSGEYTIGETADAEITIENTGDIDHTFYAGYSVRGPDDQWRDNDKTTDTPVSIDAGERRTVDVSWDVVDGTPPGEYDVLTSVYEDRSGNELQNKFDDAYQGSQFDVVETNNAPSIESDSPSSEQSVTVGDSIEFEAGVQDRDDNLAGVAWYVDGEKVETTRNIGGSSDTATWTRTFDAAGTYTVQAEAFDTDSAYSQSARWDVTAEQPDETDARITRTVADGTYSPGDNVPVEIAVENTGDTRYEFYVDASVQRPNGNWVTGEDTTISIPPGDSQTVTVDGEIPDNAREGTWSVGAGVFHSSDKDEQYASGQDLNSFEVEEENESPDADRESLNGDQSITVGDSIDFELGADDPDENLEGVEWYIDDDLEEETDSIYGGSDTADWEHTFDEVGTYDVEAVVFDEERAYSDPVSWTVTVEYDDPAVSLSKSEPDSPTTAEITDEIEFEAVASESADAIDEVVWYVDEDQSETITSSSETITWQTAFDSPGEYTVTARASTETEDDVDSVTWTVEVSEPDVETTVAWSDDIPESVADDEQLTLTAEGITATDGELCLVSGSNQFNTDDIACRDIDAGEFEESFTVRSGMDFLLEDSDQTTVSFRVSQESSSEETWSSERTIRTESTQGLTVTAEDEDGDPLSNAEVSVDGLGVETTNEEGKATFETAPVSESEVTVTDASGHVVETESVDPETVSVVVEFPQLEPVTGVIRDDNGNPLPEGTKVEISGTSFVDRVDRGGEFALPYQLPEGDYTLHIDEYEPIELDVDGATSTYEFQTIKTSKTKLVSAREKAFTKGVVCGDPCWAARNYNEEHSMSYLSGWIITGFTPVAGWLSDGRDFGSSIARGDGVDAGLSFIAIASGAAAAPKAAKSIRRFVTRYPGKSDEVAKLVLKSDKIPTSLIYKAVYRNAPESVRAADDAVVLRLVDEGVDLNQVRLGDDITRADVDTVAKNVDQMEDVRIITKDSGDGVRWLDEGTENVGWEHIQLRHIDGSQKIDQKFTTFWPTGQTIKGRTLENAMKPSDVKRVIQRAVKKSDTIQSKGGGKVDYVYDGVNDYGISEVTVRVNRNTGQIESAWPSAGDNVVGWSPEAERFIAKSGS
jgi:uncharacterized membrane protein